METGNFLFQVNIPDDWNGVTYTWYTILDYTNSSMAHWSNDLGTVASNPLIRIDSVPSKADLALKYGPEFGFFLPLTEPFDVRAQYPELFL